MLDRFTAVVVAVGVAWAATLVFATVAPNAFPIDDAYIHALYAKNLAQGHELTFNTDPPDGGIGTSSILWTLLLAASHGWPGEIAAAKMLGAYSLLAVAMFSTVIASWMLPEKRRWEKAALAGSLVALSGNLLWFSLSGMETMLFVALGLGAIVAFRSQRFCLTGLLVGLMLLTRFEGVALLGAIWTVKLLAERKISRGLVVTTLIAAVLFAPWVGFVYSKTGRPLPTTFAGKKYEQQRASVLAYQKAIGNREASASMTDGSTPWWMRLTYPLTSVAYASAFVVGGAYLPWRFIPPPGESSKIIDGLSILVVPLAVLFVTLLVVVLKRAWKWKGRSAPLDDRQQSLVILGLWVVLHNAVYWLLLPTLGTADRYQAINHVAFWLAASVGAWWLARTRVRQCVAVLLVALALVNALTWRGVYHSNIRHMVEVRMASATYVREELPRGAVVAAHDIGVVGLYGEHRIVDLGGLTDPTYLEYAKSGRLKEWFRLKGVEYVVLPTKHSSEKEGLLDFVPFLGLDEGHGIRLEKVAHFENSFTSWYQGYAYTWNAFPGVTIFRVVLL